MKLKFGGVKYHVNKSTLFFYRYITVAPNIANLTGIRTIRVLRALRTFSALKGKYHLTFHFEYLYRPDVYQTLDFNFAIQSLDLGPLVYSEFWATFGETFIHIRVKILYRGTDCRLNSIDQEKINFIQKEKKYIKPNLPDCMGSVYPR